MPDHPTFSPLGVPFVEEGLGTDTVWLGGGRIGARVAAHGGIERIIYYGCQSIGRSAFFSTDTRSAYVKLFKVYLVAGFKAWRMELNNTLIYPGGYRSTFAVPSEGIEIEHDLILVSDAIHQTVRIVKNRKRQPLRLRVSWHDYTAVESNGRKWGNWDSTLAPNLWARRIVDANPDVATTWFAGPIKEANPGKMATWFGIVGNGPMTTRSTHSGRRFFETAPFRNGAVTVSALFGYDRKKFIARATYLRRNATKESTATVAGWEKHVQNLPGLRLGVPAVESFFRMSPLLLESVMPADLPGAMRASAGSYWVWGWDTLVHCEAYLAAGQHHFVRDALALYHRTAHPTEGIGHQFGPNMELRIPQAPAAQGLYPYALYQYVAYTGDRRALREHYPMVLRILDLALSSGHRDGLFEGRALFPDHPQFAGHTGHDISVFNNSIFYQAARSVEHLAGWMNDSATAKKSRAIWQGLAKSFDRFWDPEKKYWVDSLDFHDLSQRRSYPAHAILAFSPFARDLVIGREESCAQFMATHLVFKGGLRMYPLWDPSFNGDGNQLGQQYQVNDPFFVRTQAAAGRQDLLVQWLGWLEQFWNQNTVPEGVTLEAENEGPQYPDCPGGKQPFSSKAWYMAILNAILGVQFDAGGATFGTGLDRPASIEGIYFSGRRWNIRTNGKGRHIAALTINGVPLAGTAKIPADLLRSKTINVEVKRAARAPSHPQLTSADGARLTRWKADATSFRFHLSSPASVIIRFTSPRKPTATWEAKPISVTYNKRTASGEILLACPDHLPLEGTLALSLAQSKTKV